MSGIFGIFQRDAEPATSNSLQTMQAEMTHWGPDGSSIMLKGIAGLGQSRLISTPEGDYEHLPFWNDLHNLAYTAAARLDNRDELLSQ
ncbi:MAG: asparagine synthetase B, partial [Chloroflexota bacterium]